VSALRSAGLRWLWSSTLGIGAAQTLDLTASAWLALGSGGGPLTVGAALAARALPKLLFGLAAGTVADRFDRRRVVMATGGIGAIAMGAAAWSIAAFGVVPWQVILISFVGGCLRVTDAPARQALVLDIVDRERAPNAFAAVSLAELLSKAAGAFAAGVLIAGPGAATCYFAVSASYAWSAALALPLKRHRADLRGAIAVPFARAFSGAARLVLEVPTIRTLALAAVAAEVFAYSYSSAVPVLVRDVLHSGPQALGNLTASAQIGATLALLGLSIVPPRVRREPLLGVAFAAFGVSLIALAASSNVVTSAVLMFVTGACAGLFDALQQLLMQLAVPIAQRGRAAGVYQFSIGSTPLGYLESGAVVGLAGAPTALAMNGAIVVGAAAALLALAPAHRWSGPRWRAELAAPGSGESSRVA